MARLCGQVRRPSTGLRVIHLVRSSRRRSGGEPQGKVLRKLLRPLDSSGLLAIARKTTDIRFDTVLAAADAPTIRAEVAALRRPAGRLARGVTVLRGGSAQPRQFQVVVDEREESWTFDRQGAPQRDQYAEGVDHSVDGPVEVSFARSGTVAPPVRLLTPELLLLWGSPASFSPVLVQRIHGHWLLVTFEHERDSADRVTVVVDERDGVAYRSYGSSEVTVLTEVLVMDDDVPARPRPRFSQLQEWPAIGY